MTEHQREYLSLANSKWKMAYFMLTRLPSAYFSGVRVVSITTTRADIVVPFKWFSQNPFRSTYFACLSMAAEMSSGLLAMMHVHKSDPPISMLVLKVNGSFHKKAKGKTTFRCDDGDAIAAAIQKAKETGEAVTFESVTKGLNESGELVADYTVLWTFKVKQGK